MNLKIKKKVNNMKNFSFEIPKEKWNIVSEVGLPKEDGGLVIDAENVVAWVSLFNTDDGFLKVE